MKRIALVLVCLPLLGLGLINLGDREFDPVLVDKAREGVATSSSLTLQGPGGDSSVLRSLTSMGEIAFVDHSTKNIPWIATAGNLVNASPQECWNVAMNFSTYSTFMPQVDEAVSYPRGDNIEDVIWTLGFRMGIIPFSLTYSLRYFHKPPFRSDWAAIGGGIKRNHGYWEFVPVGAGRQSILMYGSYSEPRSGFLQWIFTKNPHLELAANLSTSLVVVHTMKKKIEDLLGTADPHPSSGQPLSITSLNLDQRTLDSLCTRGVLIVLENRKEGEPLYVNAGTVLNAPIEKVWEHVTDYASYQKFMPTVQKAAVVADNGGSRDVNYKLDMEFVVFNYKLDYTVRTVYEKPRRISWTEVKGNLKGVEGSWEFLPLDDRRTLAFYRFSSDLRSLGWIVRVILNNQPTLEYAVQASTGAAILRALRERVNAPPDNGGGKKSPASRPAPPPAKNDQYSF